MKGMPEPPSARELLELSEDRPWRNPRSLECARFDPRFFEALILSLYANWKYLSPVALNRVAKKSAWPAVLGVALEHVEILLEPKLRKQWCLWKKCALFGIRRADYQLFYYGQRKLGGELMLQDATSSLKAFLHWGFYCRDLAINKSATINRSQLPLETRQVILKKLLIEHPRFSVHDYRDACGGMISIRQAQRDLASCKQIAGRGKTRGKFYLAKA